MGNIYIALCQI